MKFRLEYFIGPFNIYDREESLGVTLNQYDPNKFRDLELLMDKYFFSKRQYIDISNNDKEKILELLKTSLDDNNFHFNEIMRDSDEDCFYLPDTWVVSNAKVIYENIYKICLNKWY
ncbi:hypothetical protein [Celerinatantimonas sp. MCCC 1A17872]|uniref:hypothetical protein n=1 Tax=Celerinatantimonas sp. MCCC 1A17872 TaxID=3177514 RepID=UPI0038BFB0E1